MNVTTRTPINKEVAITGLYFRGGHHMKSFPKRMEFNGQEYTFVESGLRYLIQKGQKLVELFDMTDGVNSYRLKFETDQNTWTLVGMSDLPRAMV